MRRLWAKVTRGFRSGLPGLSNSWRRPSRQSGSSASAVRRGRTFHRRRLTMEPLEPRLALSDKVGFNEIMYNPPGASQRELEWVELYSQMAVDLDLSAWSLDDAVEFEFPSGTILPGGGYLVVATDPAALEAATGFADAWGPFTGRLANGGEQIELLNNDHRVMDRIAYGDDGTWPVGPDGSGATLAKLDPDSTSGSAEHWSASIEVGGTPGRPNFAGDRPATVSLNEVAGAEEAEFTLELANGGNTDLALAGFVLVRTGDPAEAVVLPDEILPAGGYRTLTAAELGARFRPESGERLFLYTPGQDALADALVVTDTRRGRWPDATGPWLHGEVATPGGPNTFDFHDQIVINEIMYHHRPEYAAPAVVEETTPLAIDATWKYRSAEAQPGTDWPQVGFDDAGWPSGEALFHSGASLSSYSLTVLSDNPAGYWRFEETDGNTAVDSSGNGRDATYTGGVAKGAAGVATIAGRSASFDGSSGFVRLPGTWGGTDVGAMAVEAWVKTAEPPGDDFQAIVSATGTSGFGHYQLHDTGQSGPYTNAGSRFVTPPPATPTGVWRHIVFVTEPGNTRVYVDGVQQGPSNTGGFNYISPHGDVHIGNGYAGGRWFYGQIDEVAVYNHALSDAEVLEHYRVGTGQLSSLLQTALPQEPTTYYFRNEFQFAGLPSVGHDDAPPNGRAATQLTLQPIVDDGAVYYLNGVEVHRQNMPEGEIQPSTPASGPVDKGAFAEPIVIPSDHLVRGTNLVAVEVHQAEVADVDLLFGLELHAAETLSPAVEFTKSSEEWIELTNRGADTIDLSGWSLGGGIDYDFEPGTALAPHEYLVVANDAAALADHYPSVNIVGDFSGRLANDTDFIVLRDARGNPADEVRYFDDEPWPEFADGGGSSLELRDPHADNSRAEAWAASDEAAKSSWNRYSYRGVAVADIGPTNFNEFILGLLDDGEILLDDVRVVEDPYGEARELIQNGDFESGTADKWRILGNHSHSSVIADPDDPGNRVLHLVSTGTTEHLSNHAETTLKDGETFVAIRNGVEYEISYRAKWLAGSAQLRTNLYFNRLPKTTSLALPSLHGTPGTANSRLEENLGPTYTELRHEPVVPEANQEVTVSVIADDPHGVASMVLWYAAAGAAFQSQLMTDQGAGHYAASLPPQAASTVVQFYVEGVDTLGAASNYPAAGADSRALYCVQDNQAQGTAVHSFRIIMTAADADLLHTNTNVMSNDLLSATVVYDENEVFYDAGVRLKGSTYGRASDQFVSYIVHFPADHKFRGVHDSVGIDRSARGPVGSPNVDEILIKHTISHAGGIASIYDDLVRVVAPKSRHTSIALLQLDRYRSVYLDSQFDGGSDYPVHEFDGAYYLTRTVNGHPEGLKVVAPGPISYTDIRDLGDDKELYRLNWPIKNQRAEDDYDHIIELNKAFSLTGSDLDAAVERLIDVDQWLRHYAVLSLTGVSDTYTHGNPHNLRVYRRPTDGRFISLPQDMDTSFRRSVTSFPLWGGGQWNLVKIIQRPQNRRRFLGHLQDIIQTTYNRDYMSYWTAHYGSLAGSNYAGILNYIESRAAFVLQRIPQVIAPVPFAITTNDGDDFSVAEPSVTIEGTGWIDVQEIRLDGYDDPPPISWVDDDRWQVRLPLGPGANSFTFRAFNHAGTLIGIDGITATSTLTDRPLQDYLRITEIGYNLADPTPGEQAQGFTDNDDFEFIELQNIGDQTLDVTGVRFADGIDFEVTAEFQGNQIAITEAGVRNTDYVEIQNVSSSNADTAGWVVALNNGNAGINVAHATLWALPASTAAETVLYRTDDTNDNYFGENIFWKTRGPGWVMVVDDEGQVADFAVWGYSEEEVASLDVNVNGFDVSITDAWKGAAVPPNVSGDSLQRHGNSDHDDASDFAFVAPDSKGGPNTDLITPFAAGGIGLGIGPGEFAVLVRNAAAFEARYGGTQINVIGQYQGKLKNEGERIRLLGPGGETILDFEYGDSGPWPGRADGKGASLEVIDPGGEYDLPGNWRSSTEFGGTPGSEGIGPIGVVVNEVLTHTDPPQLDAIELYNTTGEPIDVGGWYLSDSWGWESSPENGNYKKYRIDDGTIIAPLGYLRFDESHFNPSGGADPAGSANDFALDGAHGDDVWLMAAEADGRLTHFVDHVDFGAAAAGESLGRWPDGSGDLHPMAAATLGGANSGPRVGPVVISELMYHPPDAAGQSDPDDLEFIEIYNPTSETIDLTQWRIRGGIDFDFTANVQLAARSVLVVLPFDLRKAVNAAKWSAFCDRYGLDPREMDGFVGGYSGRLSDTGETLELQRPDAPPTQQPDFIPRLMEDRLQYGVAAPWPAAAAGEGQSLVRLGADRWGQEVASWTSADPTPAAVDLAASVVGRYVFYNNSAYDDPVFGFSDDHAIAPDKRALLPGGTATFAHYTSYVRGINGIMIDVAELGGVPTAADFQLRVGNSDNPTGWNDAPQPNSVTVRGGHGVGGSDRITIIWPDNVIQKQWLQVALLATQNTGLAEPDVFYFGNAVGEAGNSTLNAIVNTTDEVVTRNFQHGPTDLAALDDLYDYNRDRLVNTTDRSIARSHQTGPTDMLRLITAPAVDAVLELAATQESRRFP